MSVQCNPETTVCTWGNRRGQRLGAPILDVVEVEDRDLERLIQGNGGQILDDLQRLVVQPGLLQEGRIGALDVGAVLAGHDRADVVPGVGQVAGRGDGASASWALMVSEWISSPPWTTKEPFSAISGESSTAAPRTARRFASCLPEAGAKTMPAARMSSTASSSPAGTRP